MRLDKLRVSALHELRRFVDAKGGAVAMIFALSALPLLMMTGAVVDLRRLAAARSNLQATADAAALAGVDALRQNTNPTLAATNYVNAAFEGSAVRATLSPPPDIQGNAVKVTVNLSVPMTFMKLARFNEVSIKAEATATFGAGGDGGAEAAEIVLALDTTGSMGLTGSDGDQTRMEAAKAASKKLINKVMFKPDGSQDPNVRVGLVPFAQYVNVGLQYRNESWIDNTQDYTKPGGQVCGTIYQTWDPGPPRRVQKTCWNSDETSTDCSYDEPTRINLRDPIQSCTNSTPQTLKWNGCVGSNPYDYWDSNWGRPITYFYDEVVELFGGRPFGNTKAYGVLDAECPGPLIRLTTNQLELNSAISSMEPGGFTYIAPAVLWSWRLLTRGQPFNDAKQSGDAVKSLVLMTDGANTRAHHQGYYDHEITTSIAAADAKTLAVCTNAKKAGIKIYTIGFMAPESVKPLLKQCANTPTNYYDAPSVPELERAFAAIGTKMTTMRLIR
jgi:Flp pilus assembly protein TadG